MPGRGRRNKRKGDTSNNQQNSKSPTSESKQRAEEKEQYELGVIRSQLFEGTDDWDGIEKDPQLLDLPVSDSSVRSMFGAPRPEETMTELIWDPNDLKTARLMAFNPKTMDVLAKLESEDKDKFEMRMAKLVGFFTPEEIQKRSELACEGTRRSMSVSNDKILEALNFEKPEPLLKESDLFETEDERAKRNLSSAAIVEVKGKQCVRVTVACVNYYEKHGYMPQLMDDFDFEPNENSGVSVTSMPLNSV